MTLYNFGIGAVIGVRTDVTGGQPSFFGTIQDINVDIDQTLVELYGQYKMPVDIAPSKMKISGKAKFARIQLNQINNMLLGDTVTTSSGFDMAISEAHTPAASTQTVTFGTSFVVDLGVFYASNGKQLTPTTATPAVGFYIPGVSNTGTYTINTSDEVALNFYYTYNVATLNSLAGTNNLMGTGPIFSLNMSSHYTNNLGVVGTINMKLNACRSSKFTFPFSNIQYTIPDFEFMAFADATNNWGTIVTSE
jgi:hypothetical protein